MCELGGTVCTNTKEHKRLGSTGFPIKGVVVAAFDMETDQEMLYNRRGELRVLSPAKMKCYYKNDVETKKFFHEDIEGCPWGCTGDIGYVDESGYVFVLGRASDFFISDQKKIYCFDVETVVYLSENVARCKVVGLRVEEIDLICKSHLEEGQVPWGYRIWDSLPVKPNAKCDIEKLEQIQDGFMRVIDGKVYDRETR